MVFSDDPIFERGASLQTYDSQELEGAVGEVEIRDIMNIEVRGD